jgi:His/Glu/Gln/Arg/opine family amino acid ABC transporter permease subunit
MSGTLNLLLYAALFTIAFSTAGIGLGTLFALLLVGLPFSRFRVARTVYGLYVFVVRGTPIIILGFLVFYGLPRIGLRLGPYTAGILVLALYASALFAEILRGAIASVPVGVTEAAASLGLRPWMIQLKIVGPLALRLAFPAYVSMCVTAIKASSALSIMGLWELTLASREIVERTLDVFTVMGYAAAIYFVICFSLDRAARALMRDRSQTVR